MNDWIPLINNDINHRHRTSRKTFQYMICFVAQWWSLVRVTNQLSLSNISSCIDSCRYFNKVLYFFYTIRELGHKTNHQLINTIHVYITSHIHVNWYHTQSINWYWPSSSSCLANVCQSQWITEACVSYSLSSLVDGSLHLMCCVWCDGKCLDNGISQQQVV